MEIEFLGVALVFTNYLLIFQSEKPMVHYMLESLRTMALTIFAHFLKPEKLKGISLADICKLELLGNDDNYIYLWSLLILASELS